MRIRFIIIFIISMILILLSSIIITYTAIVDTQNALSEELITLFDDQGEINPQVQQKLTIFQAFSEKRAVNITRKAIKVFVIEIIVMTGVFLFLLFGITYPLKKLSKSINMIHFNKLIWKKMRGEVKEIGSLEIRLLIRAFNEMMKKIIEYEEIIGDTARYRGWKEISRIIVHEINNIISPIETYSSYLLEKVDEKERDKVSMILSKSNEIKSILQKLRDISHLPKAYLEYKEINPIIKDVISEFKNVEYLSRDKKIFLYFDEILIKEIIRNLIKNALESGEKIKVTIHIAQYQKDRIKIIIKDNGPGIPEDIKKKLFIPGFSTKKGNIGIGLALVKGLASVQNASIELYSKPGFGSIFTLIFPVYNKTN